MDGKGSIYVCYIKKYQSPADIELCYLLDFVTPKKSVDIRWTLTSSVLIDMGNLSVYNLRGLQCLVVGATLQSAGLITTTDSPESIQLHSEQSISLIAVLFIDEKRYTNDQWLWSKSSCSVPLTLSQEISYKWPQTSDEISPKTLSLLLLMCSSQLLK